MSRIERRPPGGTHVQSSGVSDWRLASRECQSVPWNASSRRYRSWETAAVVMIRIILCGKPRPQSTTAFAGSVHYGSAGILFLLIYVGKEGTVGAGRGRGQSTPGWSCGH